MSTNAQKEFFVAAIVLLLALPTPGQRGPDFQLVARRAVEFHSREFRSPTSPQVNKAQNTLTFSGSTIRIVALAGPEDNMFSYKIAGLTNPTVRIPAGVHVRLTVVNVDDDMLHDLVISYPRRSFPMRPEVPPQAVRTDALPARHGQTYQAEVLEIKALRPGSYEYFCSIPGHAKGGMHGLLDVLWDSPMKTNPIAARQLTKEGDAHG